MPSKNENAASMAGKNGVLTIENLQCSDRRSYSVSDRKVRPPAECIAGLGRREACEIMASWLDELRAGIPFAPFDIVEVEAESWASIATPFELEAYFRANLQRLDRTAIGVRMRKRLFWTLWSGFTGTEQQAFLVGVSSSEVTA